MISCSDINFSINNKPLLRSVNLAATPNAITTILGANGAGKSTLLKVLLGQLPIQNGQVVINRVPLAQWHDKELAKIRAYMAQSAKASINLPVYEYLSLARLHYNESQYATNLAVETMIQTLKLEHFAKHSITDLSGGEWQRVELGRVWCQLLNANKFADTLLILDEPSAALDIKQTQQLYMYLSYYTRNGGTVLMVEHDINLAARFSQHLIFMKQGQVGVSGPVHQVFTTHNINHCFAVHGEVVKSTKDEAMSFIL